MKTRWLLLVCLLLPLPQLALADWSTTTKVQRINIGANGQHGTIVILEGYVATGSGCTVPDGMWFDGSNPNYEAFLSTLLAIKMADKKIRVLHSGCSSDNKFPKVVEVLINEDS